jgi:hypothetical protein
VAGRPPYDRRCAIGDWYLGPDPDRPGRTKWLYDKDAPTPGPDPSVTQMLPAVTPAPQPAQSDERDYVEIYEREDGSIYGRVDPGWFDVYDEVDSRTIVDPGAPHTLRGGPPDAA